MMAVRTLRTGILTLVAFGLAVVFLFLADPASATPLAGANSDMDSVCGLNNGAAWTSFTTQANSATTVDVGPIDSAGGTNYKEMYFGMNSVFDKLYIKYGQAGSTGTVSWSYWNGAWTGLSGVSDGTGNLKNAAGTYAVSWTLPTDWTTNTPNAACGTNRYYMRMVVGTGYGTNPDLDQISPVEYNLLVRANNELGAAMTGLASSDFSVTAGTTTTVFGLYEIGSGDYYLSLDTIGADHNFDVAVSKNGYVQTSNLVTGVLSTTLTDKTGSPFSAAYSQKVTVTREVDSAAFSGATVTGGSVTFTESGSTGVYYGAVLLANDGGAITVAKAGYVTNTASSMTNRAANTDAQGDNTATGIKFSQKVTITREGDSAALSGATVTSGGATFVESGSTGIYYGAVTIASDNAAITIAKAGYVTNTAFSTTDRTANTDAQGTTSATGINVGQKVTVTREVDGAAVSGATVTSAAITFFESGATGVYYGVVPIGSDNAVITITKSGYVTNTAFSTTDRTMDTDAQGSVSATNVKFSQKVTITRELDGAAFSGATVTSSAITFVESGSTGVYYGVVPTTSDGATISIAKTGYVTNTASITTDRAADTDAQGSVTASNIRFGQKATVVREVDAAAFSGATVTSSSVTFIEDGSTGIYYGAVPIGSDGATITISKTGYVTNTAWSTTDRTADTDAQGAVTATGVKFSQKVTVTREGDTGALNGAAVTSSSVTFIENGATGVYYGAVPIASDGVTITISKSGYVTNTAYTTVDRAADADAQGIVSAPDVRFGQKVTVTREVDAGPLTGATVTSNSITFLEIPASSGVYFGIMTPAQDGLTITIAKAGYVTNSAYSTVDRSAASDAQGDTSPLNIRFGQKVTATRELDGTALTGATVTSGGATFVEDGSTGIYYGAVSISNDNAAISIAKAGYATNTAASTTDRTGDTDGQGSSTAPNIRFGQKVTITRELDGAALSGATVTSASITFIESGATGVYYAAVPIGSDNAAINIAKAGYVTNTAFSTTDRTADADAQGSVGASNIQFGQKVTITRELDAAIISGATVTSASVTFIESGSSGVYYGAVPIAGDGVAITIAKAGYVTDTASSTTNRVADSDAQGSVTATNVRFGQKVTVTREADSAALTGASVTSASFTFIESGATGVYYGAVPIANDNAAITIAKAGYVTNAAYSTTDRAADTDAQGSVGASNVQFGQKVTITREVDAASLTGAAVTSASVTFVESGATGVYYGAVPTGSDNAVITISKAGYVTNAGSSTTDRAADEDAQGSVAAANISFGQKVTVRREVDSALLSGATITSGGATFIESGSSAVYYGAVPIANDNAAITIVKAGYVTNTASSTTDRTADTDGQSSVSATNVRFGQKVTITREVDAAAFTGATVTSGGATFIENGATGVYYGAVPIANDNGAITVAKAGYVTNTAATTTDRTSDTDSQGSVTASDIRFGQKVTITREADGAALSSATVTSGGATFIENGATGVYYGAVPIANDNAAITIAKAGYVTNAAFSTTDRAADADAQGTTTATDVRFGQKVTITRQVDAAALTGATVTSNSITFTEVPASSGLYYAVMTPAQDSQSITIQKDGYVTNTTFSTTDRAADADAQGSVSATNIAFSQKVTLTREVDGAALSGASVTSASVTFLEDGSSGVYYGAVPIASDGATITAAKDAYVTDTAAATTDRTAHADAQGNVSASNVRFTIKITLSTETTLAGVSFEKKVGAGSFGSVSPTLSSGGVAYFAQSPSEADLVFRATKYAVSNDTGSAFTASAASQTSFTLALVGALTSPSTAGTSLVAGATTTYTFGFTTSHVWPAAGKVAFTLPAAYTVGSPAATLTGADGTATAAVVGQTITVTRANDGTDTAASTAVTVALTQVTNPHISGGSGTFAFALKDSAATTLDSGTGPAVTITVGALGGLSTNAADLVVGHQTTYTLGFTNANPWPADGKLAIAFPTGFVIGSPAVTLTGADGTATASVSDRNITVSRVGDGSQTPSSTAITVDLTQITNPTAMGATGVFGLTLRTAASVDIDVGNAPAVTIDSEPLYVINVAPANPTLAAGFGQAFTVTGEDQYGNAVPVDPTWDATCGSVDGTGSYTAPTAAPSSCDVTATDGAIVGSSTVTVTPDVLDHILVTPLHPLVQATTQRDFNAAGYDQYNNTVGIVPTWAAGCGSIDSDGLFTAPSTSQACSVNATVGAVAGSMTFSITAAPLSALATAPGTPAVGAVTTYTFKFKNGDPWPATGKLDITFPAAFGINAPTATLTGAKGTATASVSGNVVTVTRNGDGIPTPTNTGVAVKLTGITNPIHAGASGVFPLILQDGAGDPLNSGNAPSVTIKTPVALKLAPKPTSATANAVTTYTATDVKMPVLWPANGTLVMDFPSTYDLSALTYTLAGIDGTTTPTIAGTTLTIQRNGDGTATPVETLFTLTLNNVQNPPNAGTTASLPSALRNAAETDLAQGTAAGYKITTLALKSTLALPDIFSVSAASDYTFAFSSPAIWPADGRLVITPPAGLTAAAPTATILSGANGTVTASLAGSTITLTRNADGTDTPANTLVKVLVTGLQNPPAAASLKPFQLALRNAGGIDIAAGTAAGPKITLEALTDTTSKAGATAQGATTLYTFSLKAPRAWPNDGKFTVKFPSGYIVGAPILTFKGFTGTANLSVAGDTITVSRNGDGAAVPARTALTFTFTQITNPTWGGLTDTFLMTLRTNDGTLIDSGTAPAAKLATGVLTGLTASAGSGLGGVATTYTFGFTNVNPWPADGTLKLAYPVGFAFDPLGATLTGADGTATATATGQIVTVVRAADGTTTPAATPITVAVTGVINTNKASTNAVLLTMTDGEGKTLDAAKAPAVVVTLNPLAVQKLASSTHASGVWKPATTIALKWGIPVDLTTDGYSWALDQTPDEVIDGNVLTTSLPGVANGEHTFYIKAHNAGGSWGPVVRYEKIRIDATVPIGPDVSSVTHPVDTCVPATNGFFSWTGGSDGLSGLSVKKPYGYQLDAGKVVQGLMTSVTLTNLGPGAHTFKAFTYDQALNASPASTYSFIVGPC